MKNLQNQEFSCPLKSGLKVTFSNFNLNAMTGITPIELASYFQNPNDFRTNCMQLLFDSLFPSGSVKM